MDEKKIKKAAISELAEQLFTLFLLAESGASLDDIEKKLDEMISAGNAKKDEPKFKVGDRVRVIYTDTTSKYAPDYVAKSGTVKGVSETVYGSIYAVDFDRKIDLAHTCGGHCRKKHGEWFAEDELEKLEVVTKYVSPDLTQFHPADADNSSKGFTVVVESKGDITIAKYLVGGKVKKQTAVKRYYKDKYSVNAAIKYSLEKLMNER